MSVTERPGEDLRGTLYHLSISHADRVYLGLVATFVTLLVLTNIIGVKLFSWFGQTLTAGLITYPLTFLVTDIVSEIYGKRRADFMVLVGFAMSLMMLGFVQISIYLVPGQFWSKPAFGMDGPAEYQIAWRAC
ncbi:MAG: queuosine precursor transporter, partial [Planctomycetes bacterium]|nr:queuosine precursor transporter [Planctomycetota bacterium]